jgi:ligand-binding sensor domain-containing protein/signal transduction histidine kinase
MIPRLIYIFVFIMIGSSSYGQSEIVRFESIGIDDGLSQGSVLSVLKDSRGFMWFGTQGGLNRYDGYEYKVYTTSADPTTISNNFVTSLTEDKNGNIWIGTFNGLNKLIFIDNKIERFSALNNEKIKLVNVLYKDTDQNIFIGHQNGIAKLIIDEKNNEFFELEENIDPRFEELKGKNIEAIHRDNQGNLWVGTKLNGLYLFYANSLDNNNIKHYTSGGGIHSISFNHIISITSDPIGNIWVGTDNGLNKINLSDDCIKKYFNDLDDVKTIAGNKIACVYYGNNNGFWVGTFENGISKYDFTNDTFESFKNNPNDINSLSDNNWIKSIYEDDTGILWIGTLLGGVNKYEKHKSKFRHYKGDKNNPNLFQKNGVRAIYEDDNEKGIWIGTINNGLFYFDKQTRLFTHYSHDPNNANSLQDNQIRSITQDKNGSIWIGLRKKGVCRIDFNGLKQKYTRYENDPDDPSSFPYDQVAKIFKDKQGNVWPLLYNGLLCKYNAKTDKFETYLEATIEQEGVRAPTNTIDSKGRIWIGSFKDLICYDPVSKQIIKTYEHEFENPQSLPPGVLRCITESSKSGAFWIGTNRGLLKFDSNKDTFVLYTTEDGLADNTVYSAIEDKKGKVWMSTNKGVSAFNPYTKTFENFDVSDGLQSNEFNNNAYFISKSGEIFFGGVNGVNSFYPDQIRYNIYVPNIVLTGMKLFNEEGAVTSASKSYPQMEKDISQIDSLKIHHDNQVIEFKFAALHYSEPSKNKYAYQLVGFSNEWTYTDATNRHITYTNLDPGEYTLKIKASNNDGFWNEEGISIYIYIVPHFWMTLWFKLLIALLLIMAILYGIKLRVRSLRNQKSNLEFQVSNRTKQILAQKHEIEGQAKQLQIANKEITEINKEVERANSVIKKKNDELYKINNSLEQKVEERTKELKEVVDELDQFIHRTSHDLRGPISSIMGLDFIVHKEIKDESSLFYFDIYHKQIIKMDKIITDILELTKVKDQETTKIKIDFEVIVEECIGSFTYLPEFQNIDFTINIQKNIDFYSDENLINSIIQNLIENAIKYSTKEGKPFVKIDIVNDKNKITISVSDNGIGIPKKFHKKIFDMFFRATTESHGSGLGMHIFKKAVAKLNGKVKLDSKINEGSTFEVILPAEKK